jgi:hypothetical protein
MITKCVNAVQANAQRQGVTIPTLGQCEAERLYSSRVEALDSEERHILRQQQAGRRALRQRVVQSLDRS